MHSISPYALRCFDKNIQQIKRKKTGGYHKLTNIKDDSLYNILIEFINSRSQNFEKYKESKQVYRFSNINSEPETDVYCWIEIGDYGTENDIIDIDTGKISFQKTQQNALINKFYIHFHIPKDTTTALMFIHNYRYGGAKTLFDSEFKKFFKDRTKLTLQIFPFAHKKAVDAWQDANVKDLKVIGYEQVSKFSDSADALKALSEGNEVELSIKPQRNGSLGKFKELFDKKSQKYSLIQEVAPETKGIKVEVEMNGNYRTFSVYHPKGTGRRSYEIEIDNDIEMEKNMPTFESMQILAKQLIKDFIFLME
ncbi:hypothetical protein [Phocoenobacter skyensis]|uniref:Uncharacterized protein n=1 Tax=Phocoenobacter skyensis TaxID=97481 RepID=A0A1H7V8I7_9PAST|nr:hypothetical protein [Pasteurella skyensis]QLB23340.1 hypothetical protein A6B44_09035 [Pasteurella skyensis]SEM05360.1 hypothetical protein SAMN05444853_1048 [Pasteurella skyensis]